MASLDNKALIVLGMHRSGTSMFTGVLHLLGIELGTALQPPDADNPEGYWEHSGIVAVHNALLETLGSHWADVTPLPDQWWLDPRVEPFRRQLADILIQDFSSTPIWALKDPRLCRLLPLWVPLLRDLGCVPTFVQIVRNPLEVADSLRKRDGFSVEKSLLLWLEHTLPVGLELRGQHREVILFDRFFEDWQMEMNGVAGAAEISWPTPFSIAEERVNRFIKPSHRHHRHQTTGLERYAWVNSTYEALRRSGPGGDAVLDEALNEVARAWLPARALFGSLISNSELARQVEFLESRHRTQRIVEGKLFVRLQRVKRRFRARIQELRRKNKRLREMENTLAWKIARRMQAFGIFLRSLFRGA